MNANVEKFLNTVLLTSHGVFTLSMLNDDVSTQRSLRRYIQLNENLFSLFKGSRGDLQFFKISKKLARILKADLSRIKITSSSDVFTFFDLCQIGSFCIENEIVLDFKNEPHPLICSPHGRFGIISCRYGVSSHVDDADFLLGHPFLAKWHKNKNEEKLSRRSLLKVANAYCPTALRNVRSSFFNM